ncbi:hypothetical protein [Methanosarcina sp. KYL-1]|uniref:hypothetical protein n=1 Tax=Methanosarcina sp. KYL-1 TaxID=2602068 RepID=UPI002100CD3E|nr:hypothetical protein [Methanosarcina sp. KYL-1]
MAITRATAAVAGTLPVSAVEIIKRAVGSTKYRDALKLLFIVTPSYYFESD